jgi:hypothetical protein
METKMKSSDGGKGSSPRPFSVSQEEYDNRWDAIFSRDLPKETEEKVTRYNEETQEVKKNDN